LGMQDFNFAQI